jgi:hypothetical protein
LLILHLPITWNWSTYECWGPDEVSKNNFFSETVGDNFKYLQFNIFFLILPHKIVAINSSVASRNHDTNSFQMIPPLKISKEYSSQITALSTCLNTQNHWQKLVCWCLAKILIHFPLNFLHFQPDYFPLQECSYFLSTWPPLFLFIPIQ